MKIRSKALYQYLLQANVLNGSKEDILRCKQAYRKEYKRNWKRKIRPRKEIRIDLTLRQFEAVRRQAALCGLRHTPYARKAILLAVDSCTEPLSAESLSKVLQLVSMAAIALARKPTAMPEVAAMLDEAEQLMMAVVKNMH